MSREEKDNKRMIFTVVSLLLLVIVVIGVSYAAFSYAKRGSKENVIKTGTITMTYTEGSNKISINNAVPMEDSVGKLLSNNDQVFDFTISINIIGNTTIAYEVTAEKDDTSTLGNNDVRIYLEKSTDATNYSAVKNPSGYIPLGEEDEFKASAKEMRLDVGSTTKTATYYYRLRMWISKDYGVTNESRFFTIRVNAYGSDNVVISEKPEPMSPEDFVNKKANPPGITDYTNGDPTQPYVFEHPATAQTPALTDYRYIGNDPANYVEFNDEIWRIIGIFDVDDGTGNYEKRMKLIRLGLLTGSDDQNLWDVSEFKNNNWSKVTSMQLLNSGDYYNRSGAFSTRGLTVEAKAMIADSKWYLAITDGILQGLKGSDYYNIERGQLVYDNNPINWIGKVGLMYPSDYVYTYANGVDDDCYTDVISCGAYNGSSWIYKTNYRSDIYELEKESSLKIAFTIFGGFSKNVSLSKVIIIGMFSPSLGSHSPLSERASNYILRPVVYLSSDIKVVDGEGTLSKPYKLNK